MSRYRYLGCGGGASGIEVAIGNGIVIPYINVVRIAEAVSVMIDRILRRLPVFTTCTVFTGGFIEYGRPIFLAAE